MFRARWSEAGHPIPQVVPVRSEDVEKKLNASDKQNRKQEAYPNDGQCRPAGVVLHTTYSLCAVRETHNLRGDRPRYSHTPT